MKSMYASGADFVLLDDEGLILHAGCVLDESVMCSVNYKKLQVWMLDNGKKHERVRIFGCQKDLLKHLENIFYFSIKTISPSTLTHTMSVSKNYQPSHNFCHTLCF